MSVESLVDALDLLATNHSDLQWFLRIKTCSDRSTQPTWRDERSFMLIV